MRGTLQRITPEEISRAIAEPTGPVGAAFYFHPDTMARGKELGLDGFRFYALGRGGVLGDVEAGVVHSAFGYFNPSMVARLWDSAMALFAGLRAEPVPTDVPAAAYHYAVLLRELRGGAHLVAVTAMGLPTVVAHAIKRPDAVAMFGWDDTAPQPTDADRAALAEAEDLTDRVLARAFGHLTSAQGDALVAGTKAMHAAIIG